LDTYFAVTAPGLEPFTSRELTDLGLLAVPVLEESSQAGVAFKGDLLALYRANLHLRTASRVLARVGTFFYATTYPELQKRTSRLPWERFLAPGQTILLRVTCRQSKLYNSEAVTRTIAAGLEERLGKASPLVKADEESDGHPPQMIVVRLVDDKCTLSVDSSGALLHKRGYRLAVAKAPLRETLAAALLMASGWDTSTSLLDPFCGSGTIPIEAALLRLGLPPGLNRRFAFMDWPGFAPSAFKNQQSVSRPPTGTPVQFAWRMKMPPAPVWKLLSNSNARPSHPSPLRPSRAGSSPTRPTGSVSARAGICVIFTPSSETFCAGCVMAGMWQSCAMILSCLARCTWNSIPRSVLSMAVSE
jgi:putative N6-adenine-specific DNA methylase